MTPNVITSKQGLCSFYMTNLNKTESDFWRFCLFVLRRGLMNPSLASNSSDLHLPSARSVSMLPQGFLQCWDSNSGLVHLGKHFINWPLLAAFKHVKAIVPILSNSLGERAKAHISQISTWFHSLHLGEVLSPPPVLTLVPHLSITCTSSSISVRFGKEKLWD